MPNLDAAKKSVRADKKKTVVNLRRKRTMKDLLKQVRSLIVSGNVAEAEKMMPETQKAIDKATKRGVIKENNASRKKSRLVGAIQRAKNS